MKNNDGVHKVVDNRIRKEGRERVSRRLQQFTVPPSNSCTKCLGSPDIIHDRNPDCHTFS